MCSEQTTILRSGLAARAAASAVIRPDDAVSSMWPCSSPGRPSSCRSQSRVTSSSSCERRRGAPEDADLVEACDQELREDARLCCGRREVGEVTRALPVRDPRHQDLVEIAEDCRERLWCVGRRRRERGLDRAGLDTREDGIVADVLEVAGDPLECSGAVVAERAHALAAVISAQLRVFRTCSFVSQARLAWPIPSSA